MAAPTVDELFALAQAQIRSGRSIGDVHGDILNEISRRVPFLTTEDMYSLERALVELAKYKDDPCVG